MASMITRCPKCATAFRISENHLKSAQGMVRCGSCLHVFDAKKHLETLPNRSDKPKAKPKPEPEPKTPLSTEHASATRPKRVRAQAVTPETPNKTDVKPKPRTSLFSDNDKVDPIHRVDDPDEEAWALALLEDDPEEDLPKETPVKTEAEAAPKPVKTAPQITATAAPPETPASTPSPELETEELNEGLIAPFPDDDLDLVWEDEEPSQDEGSQTRPWLWPIVIVMAGLGLIAQIAWLQFPVLSMQAPYRSYYGAICSVLPCSLPELVDRANINATNLVVRSHPDNEGALLVSVIIKNTAAFEQTFPKLRLSFTDVSNKVVAARDLIPNEYLGGELAGIDAMPIQQPIHIAISVKDPGDTAVGYKIEVID